MDYAHTLIIGPTKSGKSHIANYLIGCNDTGLKYDLILLISGTSEIERSTDIFNNIPKKHIANNLSDNVMKKIINFTEQNPNKKVLIILDDLIKIISDGEALKNIEWLYTTGRWNNIYSMALIQYFKMLPPLIRANSRYFIITLAGTSLLTHLYEHVDTYFNNFREFKQFIISNNVPYKEENKQNYNRAIILDTHPKSRNIEDNVLFIQP